MSAIGDVVNFAERSYHRKLVYPLIQEEIDAARSAYSYCVECLLDIYEYFQKDRLNYLTEGGGALVRVLCKRSVMCYFASVLRMRCKISKLMQS